MRLTGSLLLAMVVNLGLFWMMYVMVVGERRHPTSAPSAQWVDYVRTPQEESPPPERRRREPPPKPGQRAVDRAEEVPEVTARALRPEPLPLLPAMARIEVPLRLGAGPYLGPVRMEGAGPGLALSTDLMPTVQFPPHYPPAARLRGVEGFVEVEFIVTEDGRVKEPRVLRAEPESVFERAALRAVAGWRFKPTLRDGEPVPVRARQRIDFNLN